MRVFGTISLVCAFDADLLQEAFNQRVTFDDTDPTTASQTQSGLVTLAPSAASQQFDFGSVVAATSLLVIAYQEVQIQLGSNAAPLITIRTVPANIPPNIASTYQRTSQPGHLSLRGKVFSLYLSNPSSTSPAQAWVGVVGNAT